MDPVIGAAALTAAAGLFQGLMQQEQQRAMLKQQRVLDAEKDARSRLAQSQQNTLEVAGTAGQREMSAIDRLLQALNATRR